MFIVEAETLKSMNHNIQLMSYTEKTKIVATLGPAVSGKEMLLDLITNGVNVFRINFSHADYKTVANNIKHIQNHPTKNWI